MIELSADLGEGSPGEDEIWSLVDAANVACGGHTGDDESMEYAVRRAWELEVALGAHPSYPDREHFGRRTVEMAPAALHASLVGQITRLRTIAGLGGRTVVRVKPHGALYNDAHANRPLADLVVSAMRACDPEMAIVCAGASQMAAAARAAGVSVIREAFADRRYRTDGSLVPRSEPRSLLSVDEAAEQAELLVREGVVVAAGGTRIGVLFDTLCVHADMEHAVERLGAIRNRVVDSAARRR